MFAERNQTAVSVEARADTCRILPYRHLSVRVDTGHQAGPQNIKPRFANNDRKDRLVDKNAIK